MSILRPSTRVFLIALRGVNISLLPYPEIQSTIIIHILLDPLLHLIQADGSPTAREIIHMQLTFAIKLGFHFDL